MSQQLIVLMFSLAIIIADLPHGKKIFIKVFSNTNSYFSATAANIVRNSKGKADIFSNLIK